MPDKKDRSLIALVIALVVWLAKAFYIFVTPLRALAMTPWMLDDSFIFMKIARNLAEGKGYTFDGQTLTSGAPPAWTFLTSLNHFFWGLEATAKVTMAESAFFAALASWFVFRISRRAFDLRVAWGAFFLSVFLGPLFFGAMSGMETGLFTFLGLALIELYLTSRAAAGAITALRYLILGVLSGFLCLVRADGLFLAGAIFLAEFLSWSIDEKRAFKPLVPRSWLALGFVVALSPLLCLSWSADGSWVPANQAGRRFLAWEDLMGLHGAGFMISYVKHVFVNILEMGRLVSIAVGSFFVALLALLFSAEKSLPRLLVRLVFFYIISYLGVLVTYQFYFYDVHGLRYLSLLAHLCAIFLAAFLDRLSSWLRGPLRRRNLFFWGSIALLAGSSVMQYWSMTSTLFGAQGFKLMPRSVSDDVRDYWRFIDWSKTHLPAGTVVAVKDYGRFAYFTDARVVDLAGIIDSRLIPALKKGDIKDYLLKRQTAYVVMPQEGGRLVFREIRQAVGLEPVTGAPPQDGTGYVLYKLVKRQEG
jgi:hypothetical protein